MRRHEEGGHGFRQAPPFRVLAAPDARYPAPPTAGVGGMAPPPPRAPDPYKVAAASTSYARAHRRSSFVILAEASPESQEEHTPPPGGLSTGRVSPFRGRGFKGAPPRPRSRPSSPENAGSKRKFDRRGSVSQQNSPRRSFIPQPTRRRSVSLSKTNDKSPSPNVGRRVGVDGRNRLSVSTTSIVNGGGSGGGSQQSLASRRPISKSTSRLSPIEGTPTKPTERKTANASFRRGDRFKGNPARVSPGKSLRNSSLPPRGMTKTRKPPQPQVGSRERLVSPSKIPLKASVKKSNSSVTLNNNRFITLKPPAAKEPGNQRSETDSKEGKSGSNNGEVDESAKGAADGDDAGDRNSPGEAREKEEEKMALLNLLKQSSSATGTSSVVNTTTTTAVQPLKIDQVKDTKEKLSSPVEVAAAKPSAEVPVPKEGTSSPQTKAQAQVQAQVQVQAPAPVPLPVQVQTQSGGSRTSQGEERAHHFQKAVSRLPKTSRFKNLVDRSGSPVGADTTPVGGNSKSNSGNLSLKNVGKTNGTNGSAGQRSTSNKGSYDQTSKMAAAKPAETKGGGGGAGGVSTSSPKSSLTEGGKSLESKSQNTSKERPAEKVTSKADPVKDTRGVEDNKADDTKIEMGVEDQAKQGRQQETAEKMEPKLLGGTTATSGGNAQTRTGDESVKVEASANSEPKGMSNGNHGSNVSLRSTGVSSVSMESAGSTDTGVSVNTVKGVSSPREKTGVHVVKRPQEIETLSGNVMHLEQNGEPAGRRRDLCVTVRPPPLKVPPFVPERADQPPTTAAPAIFDSPLPSDDGHSAAENLPISTCLFHSVHPADLLRTALTFCLHPPTTCPDPEVPPPPDPAGTPRNFSQSNCEVFASHDGDRHSTGVERDGLSPNRDVPRKGGGGCGGCDGGDGGVGGQPEIQRWSVQKQSPMQNYRRIQVLGSNGTGQEGPENLLSRWRKSLGRYCKCPDMRCLACRRDPKGILWPRNQQRTTQPATISSAAPAPTPSVPPGCWSKFRSRLRIPATPSCTPGLKGWKCCKRRGRVAPAESQTCCPPERRFGAICRRIFSSCGACKCKGRASDAQRRRSIRAKHSLTSVAPPPLSEEPKAKIPDVLVEHNSLMRGAIPCLPVPLAWFCLVWNVLLPGTGTFWSGLFNLCVGQPRFSSVATFKSRLGAFIVNLIVGVGQLFTVLFCLVGWGWSIWWGITMIKLARKYKRFKDSEAANGDPEARAGEAPLPPGVPSHALREMERAR